MPIQVIGAGTQKKSFGEKINAGIESGLNRALEMKGAEDAKKQKFAEMAQEAEYLKERDLGKFHQDVELQNLRHKHAQELASSKKKEELNTKRQEKLLPLQGALQSLEDMRSIKKKGNLGRGSGITGLFSEDVRRDRAEYSQLGKSLIQFASSIPIRNKAEFEVLAEDLYDPSKSEAEIDGILNGMEKIIHRSMEAVDSNDMEEDEFQEPKELDVEAMQKIRQLSGGDKERAKKIAKKMGYRI